MQKHLYDGRRDMKASTHRIVRAVDTHFEYEDGTIYYPFGTTVYALLYQETGVYEQTMNTLQNAPFNKIRFCIFPKHYEWNYNEPSFFPFERDGRRWDTKPFSGALPMWTGIRINSPQKKRHSKSY